MTIYIFSILLLLLLSYLELTIAMSPATKKAISLFVYVFLVLQVGLRWETGTDWNAYLQHFESINSFSSASPSLMSPEYGYNIAVWLVKIAFPNYSVFLLIHAAACFYLFFNSIKRYTGMLFLPLMVFYCTTLISSTGANRQLIAVAIGFYALRYIYEKKYTYFFLLVALACMFHYSALILLLFPLFNQKIRPVTLLLILVGYIALGATKLPLQLFSVIGNSLGELESTKVVADLGGSNSFLGSGLSIFGPVKRVVLLTLFLYNRRSLGEKLRYYNLMLNAYIAGVVIYVLFANSLLIIVSRGDMYFNIMEPLLLASQVYLLKRRSNRLVMASALCGLSFALFLYSISPYRDLFVPYKGLIINTEYSRSMY